MAAWGGGCHDAGEGALGAACVADGQCRSSFCWAGCRDPGADDDGDGLTNTIERRLGLSPIHADTDGDGLLDKDELGPGGVENPRDTDGDGVIDALESMVDDADGDCLPDQLDASSEQVSLAELARLLCKSDGVCAGTAVVARCDAGLTCDYGAVVGYEPVEVSCDGRDNDCDGEVDEGLVYVESTGALKVLGEACVGLGECRDQVGVVECSAGGGIVCSVDRDGSEHGGAEDDIDCDGLDNDCDGEVDEGISWLEPDTGLVRRYGEACRARGVCGLSAGVVECAASGRGICSTELGGSNDRSGPERCDGLDEDCDGRVDDEVGWRDPSGGPLLSVGEPCGRGVCAGTVVACAGGVAVCPGLEAAGAEVCNGLDDDCDGQTDEADVAQGCPVLGECAGREVVATCEGEALICRYRYGDTFVVAPTTDALCDGRDEDCDGQTDEDVVAAGGGKKGEPCFGSGLCATVSGFLICSGGGLVCSADAGLAEVCDGVDNDCDGLTDEDLVDRPPCATAGVCAGVSAEARCEEGGWVCPHEDLEDYRAEEAADLDCDGLDNDCDGLVDEGSRKLPSGALEVVAAAPPVRRASATSGGDGLWVHGGLDTTLVASGELWRFSGQGWERRASGPALAGHALVFEPQSGRLFAHGGFDQAEQELPGLGPDGPATGAMWAYDPAADRWDEVVQLGEEALHLSRRHHVLAALPDGRLLLHGGLREVGAAEVLVGQLADEGEALVCRWSALAWAPGWRMGHSAAVIERDGAPWVVLAGGAGAVEAWTVFSLAGAVSSLAGGPVGTKVGLVVDTSGVVALAERSYRLELRTDTERVSLVAEELATGLAAPVVAGRIGTETLGLSLGSGEAVEIMNGRLVERADLARPAPRRDAALLLGEQPASLGGPRASGQALWLVGGVRESDDAPLADAWVWRLPSGPWVRMVDTPSAAVFASSDGVLWAAKRDAAGVALWRLATGTEARWQLVSASGVGPVAVAAIGVLQVGEETSVFSVAERGDGLLFHEARLGVDGAAVWSARGEWDGAAAPLIVGPSAGAILVAAHVGEDVVVRRLGRTGLGEPVTLAGEMTLTGGVWDPTRATGYAVEGEGLWVLEPDDTTGARVAVPGLLAQAVAHGPDGALWTFGAGLMRVPLVCE